MSSIVLTARELHELHQEAERRYMRDQLPASVHGEIPIRRPNG